MWVLVGMGTGSPWDTQGLPVLIPSGESGMSNNEWGLRIGMEGPDPGMSKTGVNGCDSGISKIPVE